MESNDFEIANKIKLGRMPLTGPDGQAKRVALLKAAAFLMVAAAQFEKEAHRIYFGEAPARTGLAMANLTLGEAAFCADEAARAAYPAGFANE